MTCSPKCVLIIDNDLDVLDSVGFNLETAGYRVLKAESERKAGQILESEIFHLAIIDIRLNYEDRTDDLSGFNVARDMPAHIPCIIFTAYEDKESIRKALGEIGAKASLDKKLPDAPAQLVRLVDNLFKTEVKTNFDLQIQGPINLEQVARQIQVPDAGQKPLPGREDVCQVLQSLFHSAAAVHLTHLLSPESAPTLTQAGSILLLARPRLKDGWGAPVVVKFSDRAEVEQEAKNYERIRPYLFGQRLAVLNGKASSRQIGGLVYTLIGAGDWESIHTFGEAFLTSEAGVLVGLLERFFSQTFEGIYRDAQRESLDLTAMYTAGLHLTGEKLVAAVAAFHPDALDEPQIHFKGLQNSFMNPVQWALPGGEFRKIEVFSRKCLCHGDLHSRNILVDGENHFWLLDFARVEESHALRDFAELESDIKYSLLPVIDLDELFLFEKSLLSPTVCTDLPPQISFTNPRLNHAYQVVEALRCIAYEQIDLNGELREYYQALLFHTLNVIRLRHISDEKKEHALLAAALICERLEQWPDWEFILDGPPASFPAHLPPVESSGALSPQTGPSAWSGDAPSQLEFARMRAAGLLLLLGAGLVVILQAAIRWLAPGWQDHAAVMMYLSVIAVIVFPIVGLVSGQAAIDALHRFMPFFFRKDRIDLKDTDHDQRHG